MEKDTQRRVVSLREYRRAQEVAKLSTISGVRKATSDLLRDTKERSREISEDSFVTRMEADKTIRFLSEFSGKIAQIRPGQTVNLRITIKDYGHDPEAEAADIASGVPHISDADSTEREYDQHLSLVSTMLDTLKSVGVNVKTGVKRVIPDEEFED